MRRFARASAVPALTVAAGLGLASPPAFAQEVEPIDIEVPTVVLDVSVAAAAGGDSDAELDLANLVQSAARGVTTVQQAPAIVTVVTQDEIRDRQFQTFEDIIDTVPGWLRTAPIHNADPYPLVRGQIQAAQLLHDGLSMFDPYPNNTNFYRVQPVELMKRVEFISGPGGVLWGSNSLVGIINVITKDAEDVDGVEAGIAGGHGDGDRAVFRTYLMAGEPDLLGGKLKVFGHASFETYRGPAFEMPQVVFSSPSPQPNAANLYGPLTESNPSRSSLFNLHGKATMGNLQLRVHYPIVERYVPMGFPGSVSQETIPGDSARDPVTGELLCPDEEPYLDPTGQCFDKHRASRNGQLDFLDRYAVLEYRTRLAGGRAGVTVKAYAVDFQRHFATVLSVAPSALVQGGLSFDVDVSAYRTGGQIDGDVELPRNARLLYGMEAFHEWAPDNTRRSRQGAGTEAVFRGPYNLSRLPIQCPRDVAANGEVFILEGCPLTFGFEASRTVLGAYLNPQWRPNKKLILDLGGRVQIAPGALGNLSYDLTPTVGGSVVYSFLENWNLKLNVAQGFRPPVFNNLVTNGEAVTLDGREDLKVETSTAGQAEVNARLFRGQGRIRELNFRTDYSYTLIQNLIQLVAGRYDNSADRGIHSVEFLGKLYVQGGHRVELGYTFLESNVADTGAGRNAPNHWFNLSAVFNLIDETLSATSTLRVLGAMEDPNRIVEHRGFQYDELGRILDPAGNVRNLSVTPTELSLDRLPPSADIMLGVTYTPVPSFSVEASLFNAFNARYYQPDVFQSYEPRFEYLPNPYEDVRGYLTATYRR
jgi:outer membrane receptor protein involved in Fe transport